MTETTKPIAETDNFIVLDKYEKIVQSGNYQSEKQLEEELLADLQQQGYEYRHDLNSQDKLLANLRAQVQRLNDVVFTDSEWQRFLVEYLDKPADGIIDKTRKIQNDHRYDFIFDNGLLQNIDLVDKKQLARNQVQVINQFEQTGTHANRYDVTILVNGLPLVHIELKKRGVAFARLLIRYTVIARRVSTATIRSSSSCKFS